MLTASPDPHTAPAAGPLTELLRLYATHAALSARAGSTQPGRNAAVVKRFCWAVGAVAAADVTAAAIEIYLGRLLARHAAPKTLHNHKSALADFCAFLVRDGHLARNPCPDVPCPRLVKKLPRYLEPAELVRVLELAAGLGRLPEVLLGADTGLRLAELRKLRWRAVDLAGEVLHVEEAKSGRPRTVPLRKTALLALRAQQAITGGQEYIFPARRTWRGGGWRWIAAPRSSTWWTELLDPIADAIPKFREGRAARETGRKWHLLRHTFASHAVQAGVPLKVLSGWLGHSSVTTTEIYAHLAGGYDARIEQRAGGGLLEAFCQQAMARTGIATGGVCHARSPATDGPGVRSGDSGGGGVSDHSQGVDAPSGQPGGTPGGHAALPGQRPAVAVPSPDVCLGTED